MTGAHRGPLPGVQPTGRQVRYPIVAMYQVAGDLITEADFVSDDLLMLRPLGVLPRLTHRGLPDLATLAFQ